MTVGLRLRCPVGGVGRENAALVFGMRAGLMGQQETGPGDDRVGACGQRRSHVLPVGNPAGQKDRPARSEAERGGQELQRRRASGEVPTRLAPLGDQPVGTPPKRAAHLVVGADHDEHENPSVPEFGHQALIAAERDDPDVDSLFDAHVDVAATNERHQQVDGDRPVAHLVAHPANRFS
jgi:hypothetical protein